MATILAHIQVKPGMEARFEALARDLYKGTNDHEKDVRRYEYWRGAEKGTYYTLLSFDDWHSFLVHQSSPHHETAGPGLGEVMAGIKLEWVDPIADASPLAPTNAQPAPQTDNEVLARYARMMPAVPQEWWQPLRKA